MDLTLARTHIEAERRLRDTTVKGVAAAWLALPSYDETNVPAFLASVLPIVAAAQRQSVALTNAYLARAMKRQPLGLDVAELTGAAVRAGAEPADVYRRPFVNVWTALKDGRPYEQAVQSGLSRATGTAAMDVQIAMRETVTAVATADPRIIGYRRVPNPGACALCVTAARNLYRSGDLMPIHGGCGCGIAPVTAKADPGDQSRSVPDDAPTPVVEQHGELGPVLVPAGQHFTEL